METASGHLDADIVIANADYRHADQVLLEKPWRNYKARYWEKKDHVSQ